MRIIQGLLLVCALCAGWAQDVDMNDELQYEEPTVLITLLVRNKAHILPMFLSYLERLDYPKHRIAFWLRCDHSNDDSIQLLQKWLQHSGELYHSVNYAFNDETTSYPNETSANDWPVSRFKHVIALKEEALQYARDIWADFIFFLDADVLLTEPKTLKTLTALRLPIVAPMLLSESLYSNFWCGMSDDYYYQRTAEYKEIYHSDKVGVFEVPMVHTAVLVDMNYAGARYLTFDRQRLVDMQHKSNGDVRLYSGPVDDIIVFAVSANSSGVALHICNKLLFGYIMQPLETTDTLDQDLQQLLNLRINMVHDLGAVPPVQKYLQPHQKLPEKTKLSFDNIFMINLERRSERREKMEHLFNELGLLVEHFAAVDGKQLNAQLVQEMGISFLPGYEDPYHHRPMTMGEIGCFLSHYRIWEQIVQRKLRRVLVLEDDIRFEPYFNNNVKRVLEQANKFDYDLIYFGRKRLKDEREPWVEGTDNLVHVGYSYWTLGYVITLQGAKKLLAVKPLEKLIPVDEFLPVMFNRHPQKNLSDAFEPRNLIAFSAAPMLLYPIHYTGETGYISDTEDSQQVVVDEKSASEAQLKSDRQQIFEYVENDINILDLEQDLKLDAPQLHAKCFELFHEIANEQNGDVYETLCLFMNNTLCMHICPENTRGNGPKTGEHVSDWFIKLLEKYPDIMSRVLERYIECVITNPIKAWKTVDEKIAIGYAAKYDAALYAKCNKSCTDLLVEAVKADDAVGLQIRALELIDCILQHQTQVGWSIFQHDVSTKPREVSIIRETILCLDDRTFSVRRKASQVLISALKQGSPITTRILNELIGFAQFDDVETSAHPNSRQLELMQEKPGIEQFAYSFEGHEELEPLVKNMPQVIYDRALSSSNGLARCSGIALLERLALINQRIIYDTEFERETSLLAVDVLSSVRKASLETIDALLQKYYNCTILIDVYCRIWPCMLNDEDTALQKIALHSFNRNVLMAIKPLEYTNEAKDLLPWRIMTTLLATQPRDYLHQRLSLLLHTDNLVNPQLVNTILSHLSTPMATEAWSLLLFISSRITNNLDAIIPTFNGLSSFNMKSNQVLALQLISYCLPKFSKPALNQLFEHLISVLRTGMVWLTLISPALLLLGHINQLSQSQAPRHSRTAESWKEQLLHDVTYELNSCIDNFQEDHIRMTSLMTTYTELIVMLQIRVDERIFKYILDYIRDCNQLNESNFDTDNERIMNWMIVVAGRLSLRDYNMATKISKVYGNILKTNDRPQLINNTLIGLNDLGKKFPSILENNMGFILHKLCSKYDATRVRAYRCVKDVILAGNIKLKGQILISLLCGLLDDSAEVAREADAFFIRYMKLYDKSLFHHCLKETPFDFNDQAIIGGSARTFKSRLKGPEMLKSRRMLYNHIIATLDDNTLLMYFGQLKLIAEKTRDTNFIQSRGALDVVMDILFIMRRICFCTNGKRQQSADHADGENDEGAIVEELAAPAAPAEPQIATTSAAAAAGAGKGRGRGARKRDMEEEPLKQLERCLRYVAETHRNMITVMSSEMEQEFHQFCFAMTMRFSNFTDFAQPAEFWQKYKQSKTKAQRRPQTHENDISVECIENHTDTDNELPLERHKTIATTSGTERHSNNYDGLATDLIFQPHDF